MLLQHSEPICLKVNPVLLKTVVDDLSLAMTAILQAEQRLTVLTRDFHTLVESSSSNGQ